MPFKVKPYQHLGSTSIYIHVRHVSDSLTCSSPVHEVTVHYILSRTELMTQCYTSTSTSSELKKHKRVFVGIKPSKHSQQQFVRRTQQSMLREQMNWEILDPQISLESLFGYTKWFISAMKCHWICIYIHPFMHSVSSIYCWHWIPHQMWS